MHSGIDIKGFAPNERNFLERFFNKHIERIEKDYRQLQRLEVSHVIYTENGKAFIAPLNQDYLPGSKDESRNAVIKSGNTYKYDKTAALRAFIEGMFYSKGVKRVFMCSENLDQVIKLAEEPGFAFLYIERQTRNSSYYIMSIEDQIRKDEKPC